MLMRLVARNFLLIREAELHFSPHLNVLTGETGTGKSLLLDALGLALGAKAGTAWIGDAGDDLHVEAVFRIDRAMAHLASAHGIPLDGPELILARRVRRHGVSECYVNGHRVLQRVLRRLGAGLVEVHGQREEERFRRPEVQRDLLDLFAGLETERRAVRDAYERTRAAAAALAEHRARLERVARDEDWIRFQLSEIEEVAPSSDEIAVLHERVRGLRSAALRDAWVALAQELLNGRDGAVLEVLETLDARASQLEAGDVADVREALRALLQGARDLNRRLGPLAAEAGETAAELPQLEERLARLEQLVRKHRKPLEEILTSAEGMRAGLAELEASARREEELVVALEEARAALGAAAATLRCGRERGGVRLGRALAKELTALGMRECRLRVVLDPLGAAGSEGLDLGDGLQAGPAGAERVHLEAETNPGSGFRPLGEIASGGEMSRAALALRVVLGERGRRLMTVFDEIDAGLGATAARVVARRLQQVARHRQVLLVTHLPVIAASAGMHFRVEKHRVRGGAVATVAALDASARVGEIARMLSGDAEDPQACQHAEALLAELVG
jgi:DNA repair protein RecN (Recombination protein N)